MRKILFPLELGNPVYREAYIYGIKFARKMNAELIILNAFMLEVGNDITEEKYAKLKRDHWFKAYNEISKFNSYYLESHANTATDLEIKFSYHFIHGKLMDEIRNIAKEDEVDLIVLPVSDKREFNKRQEKIIQDNIFEKNRASLLVIPFGSDYRRVKKIVFATDLKKINNYQQYLQEVLDYAEVFDSSIHFIHISSKEKEDNLEGSDTYQLVMKAIEKNPRHSFQSLYGKNTLASVNQYVNANDADLLVVVKHQHYFLEFIFHDSLSKEISMNSRVPVLVMREKRN